MRSLRNPTLFVFSFLFAACGASEDGGGGNSVTIGGTTYDLASGAVTGRSEDGRVYQLSFVLPDGTLEMTVPARTGAPVQLMPFKPSSFASYSPGSGEPFTLHGAPLSKGFVVLDDTDEQSLAGSFSLDLARLSGETITLSGEFSGVRLAEEAITERGNTLSCRVRAYASAPNVLQFGSLFGNNASAEVISIDVGLMGTVGITLQMPRAIQPGSYEIDGGQTYYASARDEDYFGRGTSGTLIIESHDEARRHIVGGFAYDGDAHNPSGATVPLLVNGGSFSVYYFVN